MVSGIETSVNLQVFLSVESSVKNERVLLVWHECTIIIRTL